MGMMNASPYFLRALEAVLLVEDLNLVIMWMVYDIMAERFYDDHGYVRRATQGDFDAF